VVPYLDRSDLVKTTLQTVSRTLLEGMALVVLVLVLFLGSVRGAALVALTIPVSLLWAFVLMHYTKVPANLLSLGAIDFGIIVDGAIVLMEVILRRHEAHPDQELTERSALEAALEVAKPMFFATLVIITAYMPLFAFQRVEKKSFTPMAFTVGYSLLGALLFALCAVPALAYVTYRRPGKTWRNPVFEWLRARYNSFLLRMVERPRMALYPALAAGALAVILAPTIGREFLPYLDEGSLWLQIEMPPGISIQKASELARNYRKVMQTFPEVALLVFCLRRYLLGTVRHARRPDLARTTVLVRLIEPSPIPGEGQSSSVTTSSSASQILRRIFFSNGILFGTTARIW
jgi:cobalt-zinc-cadmium resistance protein CzcA